MLKPNHRLPAFKLPDQEGRVRGFKKTAGKRGLVLFVYSKDNTSG